MAIRNSNSETEAGNKKKTQLSRMELLAYGACTCFFSLAPIKDEFGMYFLTNIALVPAGSVAVIMLITTLFDAVNDPIVGSMVDRTNSRFGRYRPYLMVGGVVMALSLILLFSIPPFGAYGKFFYYTLVMMALSIGITCLEIPNNALASVVTRDYNSRNFMLMIKGLAGMTTATVVAAITLPAVERLGGGAQGWQRYVILLFGCSIWLPFFSQWGLRKLDRAATRGAQPKQALHRTVRGVLRNRPVVCIAVALTCFSFSNNLINSTALYYYQYILNDTSVVSKTAVLGLPLNIAMALALPLLMHKVDKHKLLIIACLLCLVKPVLILLFGVGLQASAITVLTVMQRVSASFYTSMVFALMPECVDWTNWKTGAGQAGLIAAIITFMQKCGRALGMWASGTLMELSQFHATEAITSRTIHTILRLNGLYPILALVVALYAILRFPISRAKGTELRQLLHERDQQQAGSD